MKKITILSVIFMSQITLSQNFLYNTEQYGIKGSMLGGAVVAGTDESSMAFYNPAGIYKASSEVNISLFQPSIKTFGFDKFWGGNEVNNIDTDFEIKPSLIAFKFKIKNQDIAFIKVTRNNTNDLFNSQQNLISNNSTNTSFFDYQYVGEDDWFGLGTSFKLAENIHFGVSQFVSSASYKYINKIAFEQVDINNNNVTNFFNYNVEANYSNLSFITKLGFLLDTQQHDVGFTITTPTYLHLSKSGDYFATQTNINNLNNTGLVANNNLSPTIKTPWEFNLGYSFTFKNLKRKIWTNLSLHTKISEYDMVSFMSENIEYFWQNESETIFNYSIGISEQITPNIEISAAFRTNEFAYENKSSSATDIRNTILDGDHRHFVLGSKFKINRSTILLGLDWGRLAGEPLADELEGIDNLDLLSPNLNSLKKNNFSILLTYGFILDGFLSGKNNIKNN